MASACKRSLEEFIETLTTYFLADETTGEDYDVGIVVFADEMSYLRLPHKSGTYALVLVECH